MLSRSSRALPRIIDPRFARTARGGQRQMSLVGSLGHDSDGGSADDLPVRRLFPAGRRLGRHGANPLAKTVAQAAAKIGSGTQRRFTRALAQAGGTLCTLRSHRSARHPLSWRGPAGEPPDPSQTESRHHHVFHLCHCLSGPGRTALHLGLHLGEAGCQRRPRTRPFCRPG